MPTPTPSQQQCIEQKGNVIVVASAGTGKTSTLVQRCLHLLLQENCSLENILMVTFTEAAAAQMRVKIREELLKLTADPAHAARAEHLRQQASLLDVAQISTLHSFCLQLVRQHFQDLGIAPAVMVLDNKQTAPLITQTLDRIFEGHYAGNTPESRNVQALVAQFGSGSDEPIRSLVLKVHKFAQVLPDCDNWLVDQIALYSRQSPEAWKTWLVAGLNQWREFWLPELQARQGQAPAVNLCIAALAKPFPPGETPAQIEQIVDTIKALAGGG